MHMNGFSPPQLEKKSLIINTVKTRVCKNSKLRISAAAKVKRKTLPQSRSEFWYMTSETFFDICLTPATSACILYKPQHNNADTFFPVQNDALRESRQKIARCFHILS